MEKEKEKATKVTAKLVGIFDMAKAGHDGDKMQKMKPGYTNLIRNPLNLYCKVCLISARDFIDNFTLPIPEEDVAKYGKRKLSDYNKNLLTLPVIDLSRNCGLGWEKACMCLGNGIDIIPMLLVAKDKKQAEEWLKKNKIKITDV